MIAALLFFLQLSHAQMPVHINYTTSNGLLDNFIYDIKLDNQGFLWIATEEGLQRFDGSKFKTYTYTENLNRAGSCIQFDLKGRVWYQSFDGHFLYLEENKIHRLAALNTKEFTTFIIKDSLLITQSANNIVKYNLNTNTLDAISSDFDASIFSILRYKNDIYLAGKGLFKIKNDLNTIDTIDSKIDIIKLMTSGGAIFYQIFNGKEYEIYRLSDNKSSLIYLSKIRLNDMYLIGDKIVATSAEGLTIIEGNKTTKIFNQYNISKMIFDQHDQMILSSLGDGIFIIPNENDFEYLTDLKESITFSKPHEDKVYLATENGNIFVFDVTDKSIKQIYSDSKKRYISKIYVDNRTKLFIVIHSDEVKIFNLNNKEYNLKNIAAKSVVVVDDKYIFLTTTGGIGFLDLYIQRANTTVWDSLFHSLSVENNFRYAAKTPRNRDVIYLDDLKVLLISTNEGFVVLDHKGNVMKPNNRLYIKQLFQNDQNIYAVDFLKNLYKFNKKTLQLDLIKSKQANSDVKYIFGNNQLFYLLNSKVYKYIDSGTVETNLVSFINVQALYDFDEYYVKIFEKRFQIINKKTTPNPIFPKKLFITHVNDISVDHNTNDFDLKYKEESNIKISYTLLDLDKRNKSELFYRINGDQWLQISNVTGYLLFPSLKPGGYTIDFAVKTLGQFDIIKSFTFNIITPVYKKTWFIITFQVFILCVIFFYVYWQVNLLLKKKNLVAEKMQMEKNLAIMTLKSIKAQMNPHFFFNALNTIQAFIYSNDQKSATVYLSKFSKLTRQILENSDEEQISLDKEMNTMQLYLELEKMRFVNSFEYKVIIEEDLDIENINIPTMLIQPYVENAIKHGLLHKKGHKKLTIDVRRFSEAQLIIQIEDNGIGISRSMEINQKRNLYHRSFSSEANRNRIDLLNKIKGGNYKVSVEELYDKDLISQGTIVKILIPIES